MTHQSKIFFIAIIVFFTHQVIAQKKFSVDIEFPAQIDNKDISLYYENGKEDYIELMPVFKANKCFVSNTFFSRFATIRIGLKYKEITYSGSFWVTDKPAKIKLLEINKSEPTIELTNAINLNKVGEGKLENFISYEEKDLSNFYDENRIKLRESDSLRKIYTEKIIKSNLKKVEFVKLNHDSYYSLWLFRSLAYLAYNLDSLKMIYESFPDSLRDTFEGKLIVKTLYGRSIKKGVQAPNFIATDTKGKHISLNDFKGKYLILNFWASWCEPCVAELPAINKIRNSYSTNKIQIISITQDKKYEAFEKAVKKYKMNWIHVFRDIDFMKSYGDSAIPKVFLIDPKGNIIYNRDEEMDFNLSLLTTLVGEKIKQ